MYLGAGPGAGMKIIKFYDYYFAKNKPTMFCFMSFYNNFPLSVDFFAYDIMRDKAARASGCVYVQADDLYSSDNNNCHGEYVSRRNLIS